MSPDLETVCTPQYKDSVASALKSMPAGYKSRDSIAAATGLVNVSEGGCFAQLVAYSESAPDWIVKVFPKTDAYLAFIRAVFLRDIESEHYPVVKSLMKLDDKLYMVVMERLEECDANMWERYTSTRDSEQFFAFQTAGHNRGLHMPTTVGRDVIPGDSVKHAMDQLGDLKEQFEGIDEDFHTGNFMMRGQCMVVTDPFSAMARGFTERAVPERLPRRDAPVEPVKLPAVQTKVLSTGHMLRMKQEHLRWAQQMDAVKPMLEFLPMAQKLSVFDLEGEAWNVFDRISTPDLLDSKERLKGCFKAAPNAREGLRRALQAKQAKGAAENAPWERHRLPPKNAERHRN